MHPPAHAPHFHDLQPLLCVHCKHSFKFAMPYCVVGGLSLILGVVGVALGSIGRDRSLMWMTMSFVVTTACIFGAMTGVNEIRVLADGSVGVKSRLGPVVPLHPHHSFSAITEEDLRALPNTCGRTFTDYSVRGEGVSHILVDVHHSECCHVRQSFVFTPMDHSAEEVVEAYAAIRSTVL